MKQLKLNVRSGSYNNTKQVCPIDFNRCGVFLRIKYADSSFRLEYN